MTDETYHLDTVWQCLTVEVQEEKVIQVLGYEASHWSVLQYANWVSYVTSWTWAPYFSSIRGRKGQKRTKNNLSAEGVCKTHLSYCVVFFLRRRIHAEDAPRLSVCVCVAVSVCVCSASDGRSLSTHSCGPVEVEKTSEQQLTLTGKSDEVNIREEAQASYSSSSSSRRRRRGRRSDPVSAVSRKPGCYIISPMWAAYTHEHKAVLSPMMSPCVCRDRL